MKKVLLTIVLCITILLTACGSRQNSTSSTGATVDNGSQVIVTDTADADTQTADTAEDTQTTDTAGLSAAVLDTETAAASESTEEILQIMVSIGGTVYQARLYDNETARELVERMPLELDMEELNGNEKFFYLPESLPADTENIGNIHTGDIMLYGSDCLVLFYEDFQTSFNYTRIGYLEEPDGLSDALGSGNVRVSFNRTE